MYLLQPSEFEAFIKLWLQIILRQPEMYIRDSGRVRADGPGVTDFQDGEGGEPFISGAELYSVSYELQRTPTWEMWEEGLVRQKANAN